MLQIVYVLRTTYKGESKAEEKKVMRDLMIDDNEFYTVKIGDQKDSVWDTDNFAEISVIGRDETSNHYHVELEMSTTAMLGFGTYAIRTAYYSQENSRYSISVDPLASPVGNQAMGFFLTTRSPRLTISSLNMSEAENLNEQKKYIKAGNFQRPFKSRLEYKFMIEEEEYCLESFAVGFRNVAEMRVFNEQGVDVTDRCGDVIMKISVNGLQGLGNCLINLAHRNEQLEKYNVPHIGRKEESFDLGVCLTQDSCGLSFSCREFPNVYYYEAGFGLI